MAHTGVIYPVIMCGGSGTRLWPMSRKKSPKQYLNLAGDQTMLEATLTRVADGRELRVAPPVVVCAAGHEDEVRRHAATAGVELGDIILEPMGRNTAPVAAIAAAHIRAVDPDGLILLTPADQHIGDPDGFWTAIAKGVSAAKDGHLVTLGLNPTRAEIGYGYIERGAALNPEAGDDTFQVKCFREKPDLATATKYLADGNFFWNAGIFLFGADAMDQEMKTHAPEISQVSLAALAAAARDNGTILLDPKIFAACPSDSIDYAVMEKTDHAAVIAPVKIGWSDIGAWEAVQDLTPQGDLTLIGDVIAEDCTNSYIRSVGPLIAAIGVEDLIIVATGDTVLVTRKDKSQDVKKIVTHLKNKDRTDLL